MNTFEFIIKKYYKEILSSNNSISIKDKINECKKNLNIKSQDTFSNCYNELIKKNKEKGAVYTPRNIAKYVIEKCVSEEMIVNNPFIKILDPSCGGGNFIIELYNHLFKIYYDNLENINNNNNINLNKENIYKHILNNNIYGYDIDGCALKILKLDLWNIIGKKDFQDNILKEDFLLINEKEKFNIILGNPPYIGHKSIDKGYIKDIRIFYDDVYRNKSDLCYCFVKKAKKMCVTKGKVAFIISRYFLESENAIGVRNFIKDNYKIENIIDYYGIRPFKGTGIDPAIIFLQNSIDKDYKFEILRPFVKEIRDKKTTFINKVITKNNIDIITCDFIDLEYRKWTILNDIEKSIIYKINNKSDLILQDIVKSFQGIITGCDKAFVVDEETVKKYKIERDLLYPWIKSSNIKKNEIERKGLKLIYSNDIDEKIHKNALTYINPFKEKLNKRRECLKGIRKWYELQWGRNKEIFMNKKIIFPYKSNENRFIIDNYESYFSADIYGFKIINNLIEYETLINILNSPLYDFYIKKSLKKLGDYLYEYYPNNLLKINFSSDLCKKLKFNFKEKELYEFYNLSSKEILYIKSKFIP